MIKLDSKNLVWSTVFAKNTIVAFIRKSKCDFPFHPLKFSVFCTPECLDFIHLKQSSTNHDNAIDPARGDENKLNIRKVYYVVQGM